MAGLRQGSADADVSMQDLDSSFRGVSISRRGQTAGSSSTGGLDSARLGHLISALDAAGPPAAAAASPLRQSSGPGDLAFQLNGVETDALDFFDDLFTDSIGGPGPAPVPGPVPVPVPVSLYTRMAITITNIQQSHGLSSLKQCFNSCWPCQPMAIPAPFGGWPGAPVLTTLSVIECLPVAGRKLEGNFR